MSWFRETMLKAEAKAEQFEDWIKESVSGAAERTQEAADEAVDRTTEFAGDYQGTTDSMLRRIPGYAGYKDKELARDSDRALRNDIAQQLDQNATRVEAMQRTAATDRNVARTTELEPVVQGFRNAANLVRSLSYGYGGLFSDKPVDDVALAQLRLFDQGLLVKVAALTTAIDGLEAGTSGDASVITREIADFKAGLDLRGQVITQGRPAKPVKALVPAAATAKAFDIDQTMTTPIELPEIDLGDAMSILGGIIDYYTLKLGANRAGNYFAFMGFIQKAAAAVGSSAAFFMLSVFAFDAKTANQTGTAILGLQLTMIGLPMLMTAASVVLILGFPIDVRRHAIIRRRLDGRARRLAADAAGFAGAGPQ